MYFMSEAEFEIKYKLYAQELMNVCYGYTKDKCASEDIIQQENFQKRLVYQYQH